MACNHLNHRPDAKQLLNILTTYPLHLQYIFLWSMCRAVRQRVGCEREVGKEDPHRPQDSPFQICDLAAHQDALMNVQTP